MGLNVERPGATELAMCWRPANKNNVGFAKTRQASTTLTSMAVQNTWKATTKLETIIATATASAVSFVVISSKKSYFSSENPGQNRDVPKIQLWT